MKALHEKVNIVPILAKADTLTPSEVKKKKFKARLRFTELIYLFLGDLINLHLYITDLKARKHLFTLYFFFRPFLCRSGRRSSSMVSRYTSSRTVTLTKMRTSSNRTWSWRWEPELLSVFLFALIYFLHFRVSRLLQSELHFYISWGIFRHVNLLCCPDHITEDCPVNSVILKREHTGHLAEDLGSQSTTDCTVLMSQPLSGSEHTVSVPVYLSLPVSLSNPWQEKRANCSREKLEEF